MSLEGVRRVVVVGAHPGDESPGVTALVQAARARGLEVEVVCAADSVPYGELSAQEELIVTALVDVVGPGHGTALVSPWRQDGHPDRAAVGRAAAVTARRTDAELWEIRPGPGSDEPFVVTPGAECADDTLERLHLDDPDPWGVDSRWYERRKRDLLLAMLPRAEVRAALEIGCSTGALTEALTARASAVTGVDSSSVRDPARHAGGSATPGTSTSSSSTCRRSGPTASSTWSCSPRSATS